MATQATPCWVSLDNQWTPGLEIDRGADTSRVLVNNQIHRLHVSHVSYQPRQGPLLPRGGQQLVRNFRHQVSYDYRTNQEFDLEQLLEHQPRVTTTVVSHNGYNNPWLCGYCEDWSTSDVACRCGGCGREQWVPFTDDLKPELS